jgi:hypothetical protein
VDWLTLILAIAIALAAGITLVALAFDDRSIHRYPARDPRARQRS